MSRLYFDVISYCVLYDNVFIERDTWTFGIPTQLQTDETIRKRNYVYTVAEYNS